VLPGYLKAVHEATSSVTVKHLSSRTVEKFPLPLPPLSEQRRIVEAIEEQFSRLDAAEGLLGSGQNRLQALRSKVLGLAAAGRLGLAAARTDFAPDDEWIPPDWRWTTVRDLALEEHPVLTGPFGTSLSRKDFAKSGVPVLTIGCLTDGGVRLDKAEYVSQEKATELSRYRVRGGDVLFSRMATVGRAGVVTKDHDGALINYHLMRLRLDSHVILPDFFLIYVRGASRVRRYLREVGHGATRPGVNTEQLLTMPVALPPLDQQRLVVDEVDRQLSEISATSRTVSLCFERSKVLRVVVFREAFAGRLVPQDFSNEPTSDFLEKVRL
jgi:type I restriction enzyme S subunit